MNTRKELGYLTNDEFESFCQLTNEQRKILLEHSPEDQKLILELPAHKQRAVLDLTSEKFREWKTLYEQIKNSKKWLKNLEQAQADGAIPQKEINQAYSNTRDLEGQVAQKEKHEKELLSGDRKGKKIDSTARPGTISIRPLAPLRDFTAPRKRK